MLLNKRIFIFPVFVLLVVGSIIMVAKAVSLQNGSNPGNNLQGQKNLTITAKKDDQFTVELVANQTTGFSWQAQFDETFIKKAKQEYILPNSSLLGASGLEKFQFQALKAGQTEIKFSYQRPWEKQPAQVLKYQVVIQ